jgi:Domain of unknown function (DUF222)
VSEAAPQDESREDFLEAALAALLVLPPHDHDACWSDPDAALSLELTRLGDAELAGPLGEVFPDDPEPSAGPPSHQSPAAPAWPLSYQSSSGPGGAPWPAGFVPRDRTGGGTGFSDGGPLDVLDAGMALAGFADEAYRRAGELDDDALVGMLRAWRRLASWAQARELALVAALACRRPADGTPPAERPGQLPAKLSEFVSAEIAAALTLTGRAAEAELGLALDLADRPATAAALAAGRIDLPRAKILTSRLGPLSPAHADAVEAEILPRAGTLTTGQLGAAVQQAVLAVDPAAARVEHWADPEGTASLAGRSLPPAQALAASKRLTQIATAWRRNGAQGGMDLLRAHAYLMLLNGLDVSTPPASLLPPLPVSGRPGPGADTQAARPHGYGPGGDLASCSDQDSASHGPQDRHAAGRVGEPAPVPGGRPAGDGLRVLAGRDRRGAGEELPPLPGLISLTVPLTTLLQLGDAPGVAAGHGPIDAHAARQLARIMAGHRGTRWQIIVTSPDGQALAHGAARGPVQSGGPGTCATAAPSSGWSVRVTAEPIAAKHCDHRNAEPGYRPSPGLQRLIRARTVTCTGPGCRRPAARCDLDHTIPHDGDGITCECNLGPLCRFCHRLKQAQGWTLKQASPGVMTWTTPAGRRYITMPSKHPT